MTTPSPASSPSLPVRATALEQLVAPEADVIAFELWGKGDPTVLLDAEAEQTVTMMEGRKAEFAAGRACARAALACLGATEEPLLKSGDRRPRWPAGLAGSISHTRGYCVAAAMTDSPDFCLGIDADLGGRVTKKLWHRLFVEEERDFLRSMRDPSVHAAVMFSAKEAFYKAQFPITESWVGFPDVMVEIDNTATQIRLSPVTPLAALDAVQWPIDGHVLLREDLIVTAVLAHRR